MTTRATRASGRPASSWSPTAMASSSSPCSGSTSRWPRRCRSTRRPARTSWARPAAPRERSSSCRSGRMYESSQPANSYAIWVRLLRLAAPPRPLVALVAAALGAPAAAAGDRGQSTAVISTAMDGGPANGDSVAPAISGDRRWARYIAFESDATNLVPGDTNGQRDIFVVTRGGLMRNDGSPRSLGGITLISRAADGGPADGPSGGAALDGSFSGTRGGQELFQPSCVAFVSSARNLVPDDTNGVADAFVSRGPGGALERVSAANGGVTQVAVSGDCSRIAFVEGGRVRVRVGGRIVDLGPGQDPSFAVGQTKDLVFGAPNGVKLARGGVHRAKTVVPGGANPAYNDVKRRIVAYEKGGQVAFRGLGGSSRCQCDAGEHLAS